MYMGSTIIACRPRGCVSGARGKCMWRDVARSAFDGPKAALSRRQTSRRRQISIGVRADVNWDAFGPQARTLGNPPAAAMTNPAAPVHQFDFVVIGSGIAGLTYALKVAAHGRVAVITKEKAKEGCTQYAQGGVCAVLDNMDSVESHMEDTMVAGRHLNDPSAVRAVCQEGPARVLELVSMGAEFDRNDDGSLHLTREGGHSNRRIVHAADVTGKEIERALLSQARANANIHFFEHHLAVDLVLDDVRGVRHCFGVDVLDQHSDQMVRFVGLSTMLASGGAGQVYPNTTNPSVTTGDGIAMAFRSCAQVANMEFVQFHPTSLYDPTSTQGRSFLISEAVRGEGGLLYNKGGERFMLRYHDRAELAPRDTVARAIHQELMEWGEPHVLLDISHKPSDSVLQHFPNIAQKCLELGIDITKDPIPVVPAQHYLCGGVQTGLLGETSVQGLYACGEVACTGLHGANRLASNSLLEGLVFAHRAVDASVAHAEHALRNCGRQLHYAAATADFSGPRSCKRLTPTLRAWVQSQRQLVNTVMWDHCGIIRRVEGLQQALNTIATIYVETRAVVKHYGVSTELQELLNVVTCAELIVSSALQRRESRGLHFCVDYPTSMEHQAQATVISSSLKKRFDLTPLKVGLASSDVSSFITLGKPPPARRLTVRSLNEPEE